MKTSHQKRREHAQTTASDNARKRGAEPERRGYVRKQSICRHRDSWQPPCEVCQVAWDHRRIEEYQGLMLSVMNDLSEPRGYRQFDGSI